MVVPADQLLTTAASAGGMQLGPEITSEQDETWKSRILASES